MAFTSIRRAAMALALLATASCTVKSTEPPPLSGPSGLALTLTVNAIPDSISQDGGSQSSVRVTAVGPDGKPVSSLPVRVDMVVNGVSQDFGTLSARTIVTNADGVATVVYTAPPAPPNGVYTPCASSSLGSSLPGSCVSIVASATATNFATSNPESVLIRLVPQGVILPTASAPTAAFTYSPSFPPAGSSMQFDASTSQPGSGATQISTYSWNFGDGTTGSGQIVNHTYAASNNYVVTLTVTNDRGLAASSSQNFTVGAASLPTPSFTSSPLGPAVGETVFFSGVGSTPGQGRTIVSYRWSFGDGTSGSGVTVSHAYTVAGTYVVQLTVTDDAGTSVTSGGGSVVVGAAPAPTANFTFSPAAPVVGQTVLFDYRTSTTVQGSAIVTLDWNFGDGTAAVRCPGNAACAANGITSHVFPSAGTFSVTLVITDAAGRTGIRSTPVSVSLVSATPPTANFTFSPAAPAPNQSVLFNASSSTPGAGHTIPSTGYAWNFGDGATGTGVTPSHPYTAAGTYTVTLTVTDEIGQSSVTSKTVPISSAAAALPIPAFTFSPAAPGVGETVFFNASTSTPGAGHTITAYAWTFGDGATATGVTATRAYATAGTYSVQLKVTDEVGQSATSAASTITVGNPPAPTANFTSSPLAPVVNQAVVFDASSSTTAQGQTITSLAWNFGDGTPIVTCPGDASCNGTRIITKTYTAAGTYVVNLVVTDSAGRIGSKSATVVVGSGNPVPVITFSPSAPKVAGTVAFDSAGTTTSGGASVTAYSWTFPSGTPATSTSASPSVTWAAAGTYTVRLTVTDSQNRVGTTTVSVVVVP